MSSVITPSVKDVKSFDKALSNIDAILSKHGSFDNLSSELRKFRNSYFHRDEFKSLNSDRSKYLYNMKIIKKFHSNYGGPYSSVSFGHSVRTQDSVS